MALALGEGTLQRSSKAGSLRACPHTSTPATGSATSIGRSPSTSGWASRKWPGCPSATRRSTSSWACPGEDPRLELTYNHGVDSYELGTGYNHIAIAVDDLEDTLEGLGADGIEPEKPPYRPGGRTEGPLICFVRDPDGYRIELIGVRAA